MISGSPPFFLWLTDFGVINVCQTHSPQLPAWKRVQQVLRSPIVFHRYMHNAENHEIRSLWIKVGYQDCIQYCYPTFICDLILWQTRDKLVHVDLFTNYDVVFLEKDYQRHLSTGLWREIFATKRLLRTLQKFRAHE